MTDDTTNHQPTPEFRASLEREVVRAWRREVRFGAPSIPHRNWGVAKVAALAASAIAMLVTGLVLGASTGYASAGMIVKRRGGTPLPPQAPLAVLKSIPDITSLSCIRPPRAPELRPTKQGVPVVELPAASMRTTDSPLRGVLGVRETSNGDLLVNDAGRRQLKLYDGSLALRSIVRDSAPGSSTSYGRAMVALIRYSGDSSLMADNESGTFLVLGPSGQVGRVFAPTGMDMRFGMQTDPGAADDKGRLVYSWKVMADFMHPSLPGVPDSATLFRADLETRHVDTLARIRVGGSMGMFTRDDGVTRVYAEPVAMVDNYAQLSDGSIAIVRGYDYHVDWILPDGAMKTTPKMPFDWKRMTDAEKQRLIDSTAEATVATMQRRSTRGAPTSSGAGDVPSRLAALADAARSLGSGGGQPDPNTMQRPVEFVRPELKDLPDYFPAIRPRASMPDLDGNLWILPTSSAQSKNGELVYDVVNAKGDFHRVRFPVGRSLAGFGKGGVVFMIAGDKTNGFWIEKTRVPPKK
jgi:hypothetical protein